MTDMNSTNAAADHFAKIMNHLISKYRAMYPGIDDANLADLCKRAFLELAGE